MLTLQERKAAEKAAAKAAKEAEKAAKKAAKEAEKAAKKGKRASGALLPLLGFLMVLARHARVSS